MKRINITLVFLFIVILLYCNEKAFIDVLSRISVNPNQLNTAFVSDRTYTGFQLPYMALNSPQKTENIGNIIRQYLNKNSFVDCYYFALTGKKKYRGIKEKVMDFFSGNDIDYPTIVESFRYTDEIETDFIIDENEMFYEQFSEFADNADTAIILPLLSIAEKMVNMDMDEVLELTRFIKDEHKESMNIIIGGSGDDVYEIDRYNTLIIDLGGDDIYSGKAGSANNGLSLIIDLEGNDEYRGNNYSPASAVNGVSIINDRTGNDIYSGDMFSCGAAIIGFAMILDEAGNDIYLSKGLSQGMGMYLGIGIIHDMDGYDTYCMSGGMSDHRETDYHAHLSQGFGYGIRDIASGGIGILFDELGNDNYIGEYFVQGSSYYYALGFLLDDKGNDNYLSRRYAQGAGIHFSTGFLADIEGDDNYHSWGVSQGCGHDWGTGILCDYNGNDKYISDWLSMGAGNNNGIGMLADFNGDDNYSFNKTSCGYADSLSEYNALGILYDLHGKAIINGINESERIIGKWGILINED